MESLLLECYFVNSDGTYRKEYHCLLDKYCLPKKLREYASKLGATFLICAKKYGCRQFSAL